MKKKSKMSPREDDPILVVKEPFASDLVDGRKTLELRHCPCRKDIGSKVLIAASGSPLVIGEVTYAGCVGPLSEMELRTRSAEHLFNGRITYKYVYGWKFEKAQRYDAPVPYSSRAGAIIWRKFRSAF